MCEPFVNCTMQPKMLEQPPKGLDDPGKATHEGASLTGENCKGVFLEEGWKA